MRGFLPKPLFIAWDFVCVVSLCLGLAAGCSESNDRASDATADTRSATVTDGSTTNQNSADASASDSTIQDANQSTDRANRTTGSGGFAAGSDTAGNNNAQPNDAGQDSDSRARDAGGPDSGVQDSGADAGDRVDTGGGGGGSQWWQPTPGTSWQWQLSGELDLSLEVDAYDIDLFETGARQIADLHAEGRKVICYFDTAYEPYRSDAPALEPYRGNAMEGWPGQYWLDIREQAVVDVMFERLALAAEKQCDAVEADDVDSRSNNPGFPISASDQRAFVRTLAAEAHRLGMGFALKNALEDVDALVNDVDFAINEECFEYDECEQLLPFIEANKAVFHVEYSEGNLATKGASICPQANALNFDTLIKHLDLDAPRYACR